MEKKQEIITIYWFIRQSGNTNGLSGVMSCACKKI